MPKAKLPLAQESRPSVNDLDGLWDEYAEKYKCCCRLFHVKRASLYIGYLHIVATLTATLLVAFYYFQAWNGTIDPNHWIARLNDAYFTSFVIAVSLQLLLTVLLVYGIRTERASFLLPFIIFASIAILLGIGQLANDLINLVVTQQSLSVRQLNAHLIGTILHIWCVAIVWRCYGFLGDKKVARQISSQLSTTHLAFHYGDIPYGYIAMPQPPPYADTVIGSDKQPLTIA